MARTYDPGTATQPVRIGPGLYSIDSFRGEATSYRVDLNAGTCSCPHYAKRIAGTNGECKHIVAARTERSNRVWNLAADVPTAELDGLLTKYKALKRWDVVRALWCERWDRTQAVPS
jgi:predicted nucleic acid-binding Zn finger protein